MHTLITVVTIGIVAVVVFVGGLAFGLFYGQHQADKLKADLSVLEVDMRADPRLQMFADRIKALIAKKV